MSNVPAIDGIPGIMPGFVKVPPPPKFDDEKTNFARPQNLKNHYQSNGKDITKFKRRLMSCNRKGQRLVKGRIFVYKGPAFYKNQISLAFYFKNNKFLVSL